MVERSRHLTNAILSRIIMLVMMVGKGAGEIGLWKEKDWSGELACHFWLMTGVIRGRANLSTSIIFKGI